MNTELLASYLERALAAPPELNRRDFFVGQALAGLASKLPTSEDRKFANKMLPQLAELAVTLANEADLMLTILEEREENLSRETEE